MGFCDPAETLRTPCIFDGTSYVPFGKFDLVRHAFSLNLTQPLTGTYLVPSDDGVSGTGGSYSAHTISIPSDDVSTGGGTRGGTVQGLLIDHHYGGMNARGTRQTLQVNSYLTQQDTTDLSYVNRNYVAGVFRGVSKVPSRGSASSKLGAVFGINPVAELSAGATNFLNVAAVEANVGVYSPAEAPRIRSAFAAIGYGGGQGTHLDAALDVGAFGSSVGFKAAIAITPQHGGPALDATGSILLGSGAVANGIDLSQFTFSNVAWTSPGAVITGVGNIRGNGLISASGNNTIGSGGILEFRTAAGVDSLAMSTVRGTLNNAATGELQGGIAFATRPAGAVGQAMQDRMIICHNGAVGIANTSCSYTFQVTGTTKLDKLNVTLGTPASSSAACTIGDHMADAGYVYVCTATNTWKRAVLSSW